MGGFRGSDAELDGEIAALESIARLRLRRAAADLRLLERDLLELRRERTRRRTELRAHVAASEVAEA